MSKIPRITRKHVEKALAEIDRDGVPPRRGATGYALIANRRTYPPKYVLALAVTHATGSELPLEELSGGEQKNTILRELGFTIEAINPRSTSKKAVPMTLPSTREPSTLPARRNGGALPALA